MLTLLQGSKRRNAYKTRPQVASFVLIRENSPNSPATLENAREHEINATARLWPCCPGMVR